MRRRPSSSSADARPTGFEQRARDSVPGALLRERRPRAAPRGEAAIANLLAIFELEKAIYELRYELDNRPDWVRSPWRASTPDGEERDACDRAEFDGRAPRARDRTQCSAPTRPRRRRDPSLRPAGESITCGVDSDELPLEQVQPAACSRVLSKAARCRCSTSLRSTTPAARSRDDPSFPPTLGEVDLHLIGEGRHERPYELLGAHVRELEGVAASRSRSGHPPPRRQRRRRLQLVGRRGSTRCARSARAASGRCSSPTSGRARATSSRSTRATAICC